MVVASKENSWRTKNSKIVYKTAWMKVHEDEVVRPDGADSTYSFVETPDSVFIVPIDKDKKICLIGQWRYPTQTYSWELPGGSSDGEEILLAAKKELEEETGLIADEWIKVGNLQPMNGVSSEIIHVLIAKKLKASGVENKSEEGIDNIKKVSFSEFAEMVKKGEISDAQSIAAYFLAELVLNK